MPPETEPKEEPSVPPRDTITDRPIAWLAFHEKPVMLQLEPHKPYMGCDYPKYVPATDQDGNIRAVPILRGVLNVADDGNDGIVLVIQMPTGVGNDIALVTVKPSDVVYCTHIVQATPARIVTP